MSFVSIYPVRYNNLFKLTDTDFEETRLLRSPYTDKIIIDVYSERNFNVAKNLFLFLLFIEKEVRVPIQKQIDRYKKSNKDFLKYEEDIKKYIMLL